jgi:hypothetical protein
MASKVRCEVKEGNEWIKVSKWAVTAKGWLEYEIWEIDRFGHRDVTVALARPGSWRFAEKSKKSSS